MKHDVVRITRGLRLWARDLGEDFDWAPYTGRGYFHWKLPVARDLVEGPRARPEVQAIVAQVLIDAAAGLIARRPAALRARVSAIIPLPGMFGGEVCVFFDEAYFDGFARRDDKEQRWTPLQGEGLSRRWALRSPPGFRERGFLTETRDFDFDPPSATHGEIWLIGEV